MTEFINDKHRKKNEAVVRVIFIVKIMQKLLVYVTAEICIFKSLKNLKLCTLM